MSDGKESEAALPDGFQNWTIEDRLDWLKNISLRHHKVGLERVQRIHLGLDDEAMEFNAESVAAMLQDVADTCDEDAAFTIHAVVRALRGKDDHHLLELKQRQPGKFVSPNDESERYRERVNVTVAVHELLAQGKQAKAAVSLVAEQLGRSRSWVYATLKECEEERKRLDAILAKLE